MKPAYLLIFGGILLLMVSFSMVGATPGLAQEATATAPVVNPVGDPPTFLLSYYEQWVKSAHAKADSEAFNHWNDAGVVEESCATCHSTTGYRDFLGADGSAAGKVDVKPAVGTVVNCDACHNAVASSLQTVSFPSGSEVGKMGASTRCIVCHQGRASGVQVNAAVDKVGLTKDVDKSSADLGFINIHYFAAAASLYGSEAHGGFEYEGKSYQRRFMHEAGLNECTSCHSPHTLEIKIDTCKQCHEGVTKVEDLQKVRMMGSLVDYDGDGNIEEGLAEEIKGLQEILLKSIQTYATDVVKAPIVYKVEAYPYFFADANANGAVDEGETKYVSFTPRLLQAAYNYQMSVKDPGAFAHNGKYIAELLYDSIESLNQALGPNAVDMAKLHRNPAGHFDSTAEAFRHWDEEGEVPGSCAKCHSADGLPMFLHNNTTIAVEPSNGLGCMTCHEVVDDKLQVRASDEVTFPSGAKVSFGEGESANICLNCHQGRESTVSVDKAIKASAVGADEVSDKLTFRNVHYFAAGASLFGTEAKGAYEFEGKQYNGRNMHVEKYQTCTSCHDNHALNVKVEKCERCHDTQKVEEIRASEDDVDPVDYNGNGDVKEPIKAEVDAFKDALLKSVYAYADKMGNPIVYTPANHPYWFNDLNKNGTADPEEINSDNRFAKWTPNLLRAAYNYQFVSKDPGSFAHNARYIMQVLYDSIEAVGGKDAVANFIRPEVEAADK